MLHWKDGQPFSDRYGDVYFSTDSGVEETRHVFLQGNRLAQRFATLSAGESLCIGETGFGTGLNFLCAWQLFEQSSPLDASLDFFSVEKFPLSDEELRAALALWPELNEQAETLLARWQRRVPGWNRWNFAGGRVRLTLAVTDVDEALPQLPAGCVDAWFLDGFSPARNPEMWGEAVLAGIARASRDGATLATYTCAGWVRRGLQQAGFAVERVAGFGRKREMVRGELAPGELARVEGSPTLNPSPGGRGKCSAEPFVVRKFDSLSHRGITSDLAGVVGQPGRMAITNDLAACCLSQMASSFTSSSIRAGVGEPSTQPATRNKTPRTALVIGGGIAGCAAAHALALRGISVTLVDRAPMLASAASGNPRGILHARFSAVMDPLHRFVLAAYGHALALLDEVLPVDGVTRAECGLLQLATPDTEAKRIARLAMLEWPPHLLQAVDMAKASELAGLPMTYGGLWFPAGGWVVPPQVCARLAQLPLVTQRLGCEVTALERTASGWCASGEGFAIEVEQVVVCSGHQAKNLSQFAAFPLQPVRGQISILPATAASASLHAVLCAEGYCAPAVAGQHVAGATSTFDDETTDLRESDHVDNLAKIAAHMPTLCLALHSYPLPGGERVRERGDFSNIAGRAGVRCSVPGATPLVGEVEPGLYCSLAHGTRGLITAGIAGEVIAAAMCGQLAPLPQNLLDALSPKRLRRNVLDEE